MRQLPHMNELQEKYGSKGLHIVTVYAQNHPIDQIRKLVADKSIKYPLALAWTDADQRWDMSTLPAVWVVGVDGKVIFSGKGDYDKTLEAELAKVKYPGLSGVKVTSELEAAAQAFASRDYIKARQLAELAAEKEDATDATVAAAEAIVERIEERLKTLKNRAEVAEIENSWRTAQASWQIIERRFAGSDDAKEASERLARLKANKKAQLEIAAEEAIHALDRELQFNEAKMEEWIEAYRKFAERYKDSTWAEKVKLSVERMEAEKKAAEEDAKKKPEK